MAIDDTLSLADRIDAAETRIFKAVFPGTTNHYDTLFGGTALQLMDEVAFITATRFSRKRMVTVSSDKINFTKSIPAGTIIELVGRVEHVGNTSIRIAVEIYVEEMYCKAITTLKKADTEGRISEYTALRRLIGEVDTSC